MIFDVFLGFQPSISLGGAIFDPGTSFEQFGNKFLGNVRYKISSISCTWFWSGSEEEGV